MLRNKRGDMTPYDMAKGPCRQNRLLLPVVWGASWLATRPGRLQIEKKSMDGLRPPFLVLSVHQGFSDYFITPLSLFPYRANYVSDVEGFAAFENRLYRQVGCIAKRRFAADIRLVRNLQRVIANGDVAVVFPESRHSNAGTAGLLPASAAKLVKLLGVPVVVQTIQGSYLSSPFWDESHRRRVPLRACLEKVLDAKQVREMTVEEIDCCIRPFFTYDEYLWQLERKIEIDYPQRARGLHRVLYQCCSCGCEGEMESGGAKLWCKACGQGWEMDKLGRLVGEAGWQHIPHWYEWQRQQVRSEIAGGAYVMPTAVTVEALPNEQGFVPLGRGSLSQDARGFCLTFDSGRETLRFRATAMESVQTEYDYKGKGPCLVLSTRDCCYYAYPDGPGCQVTKVQFAAEHFHELALGRKPLEPEIYG